MIVFGTMGLSFFAEVFLAYVYYYNRSLSRDAEHFDEFTQATDQGQGRAVGSQKEVENPGLQNSLKPGSAA